MLTNKDNEIRTADIPERFQVCGKKLIICFEKVNLYFPTVRHIIYQKQDTAYNNSNSEKRVEHDTCTVRWSIFDKLRVVQKCDAVLSQVCEFFVIKITLKEKMGK